VFFLYIFIATLNNKSMTWFLGPHDQPQTGPLADRAKFGHQEISKASHDKATTPTASGHYPMAGNPAPREENPKMAYPGLSGATCLIKNADVKLKVKGITEGTAAAVLGSIRGYPGMGALSRDFARESEEEREKAWDSVANQESPDAPQSPQNPEKPKRHDQPKFLETLTSTLPKNPATGSHVTHFKRTQSGELSTPKISNHIEKLKDGKYRLLSHEGKNLGTFDSKSAAEKHEGEVEYFKHK